MRRREDYPPPPPCFAPHMAAARYTRREEHLLRATHAERERAPFVRDRGRRREDRGRRQGVAR
eukprot:6248165-Prymnesium_polylepis.1